MCMNECEEKWISTLYVGLFVHMLYACEEIYVALAIGCVQACATMVCRWSNDGQTQRTQWSEAKPQSHLCVIHA